VSVIVVTGATSGIGKAAARRLRDEGHEVIGVGRSEGETERCDFSSLDEVRALAGRLPERIDVLVNNAGVVSDGKKHSVDGIELTFAVNHLAPFLLTNLVLDRIPDDGRVVTTSSDASKGRVIDLNDPASDDGSFLDLYGRSKLANILFTRELARRLEGSGRVANCHHPGVIRTRLAREGGLVRDLAWRAAGLFFRSPQKGADTLCWLATSEEAGAENGGYFVDRKRVAVRGQAEDEYAAQELWRRSEQMAGLAAPTPGPAAAGSYAGGDAGSADQRRRHRR
jgi:NAD(P)-dependent dehydrogenase (short-subunit alcohol dehydrogenase family)